MYQTMVNGTSYIDTYHSRCMQRSCCRWLLASLCLWLAACTEFSPAPVEFDNDDVVPVGQVHTLELHTRMLSSLPVTGPPQADAEVELGRLLFWDPLLSGDRDTACATCHLPEHSYTDAQARAIGTGGVGRGAERSAGPIGRVNRNSQTALNVAWNGINELGLFEPTEAPMFWDNRTLSLEEQALEPLKSQQEMRGNGFAEDAILEEIEVRLNANTEYRQLFRDIYGVDNIDRTQLAHALATFQRSLLANNAPFDRWMRGETHAMTARQLSGMQEFVIAGCADCHSGPLFSDFEVHVLGVAEAPGLTTPDEGDGQFAFRTPTLRQLEFTAPYFHGGQFATLDQVIDFYDAPRRSDNPLVPDSDLDAELLEVPEMEDGRGSLILEFLQALNDPDIDRQVPETVPSGLPPGGF